jgi:hypothetical protein
VSKNIVIFVFMKAGLLYIFFIFLVSLSVSYNSSGNSQHNNDIQTCSIIPSASVSDCTLPESIISLKRIPCGQEFSEIFHGNFFESIYSDRIKMPVQPLLHYNRPATFMDLAQRVLLFLICTKSSEYDHHLWNK